MAIESLKSSAKLKELNTKRSSIKGQITKFKNYLVSLESAELNSLELAELNLKTTKFESMTSKFDSIQTDIEVLNCKFLDSEIDEREGIEQDISLHGKSQSFNRKCKHTNSSPPQV